jgi:hypothetical protein
MLCYAVWLLLWQYCKGGGKSIERTGAETLQGNTKHSERLARFNPTQRDHRSQDTGHCSATNQCMKAATGLQQQGFSRSVRPLNPTLAAGGVHPASSINMHQTYGAHVLSHQMGAQPTNRENPAHQSAPTHIQLQCCCCQPLLARCRTWGYVSHWNPVGLGEGLKPNPEIPRDAVAATACLGALGCANVQQHQRLRMRFKGSAA